MKSGTSINVFVYGTLKPGEANFSAYCEGKISSQMIGYTKGNLYALPVGYPAMTEGKDKVWGVLLTFRDSNLLDLDRLEGYESQRAANLNEYNRIFVSVYDEGDRAICRAWAYCMSLSKVRQYGGVRLHSGSWTGASSSN